MTADSKRCSRCGEVKPGSEFYVHKSGRHSGQLLSRCKPCGIASSRQWNIDNKERTARKMRDYWLRRKYGITRQDYDDRLEFQGGQCAICGTDNPGGPDGQTFCVDHDHVTGLVRGLLCGPCNLVLGAVNDDKTRLERMLEYLEASAAMTEGTLDA